VYVLECKKSQNYKKIAAAELGRYKKHWPTNIDENRRLIYVGVTKNLLRRLNEHLNKPRSAGADFTAVFPPIRLLSVSWYQSYRAAAQAEKQVAAILRNRYPDDLCFQK
jgi:predicted GIY-YIG superfamily endonuclease